MIPSFEAYSSLTKGFCILINQYSSLSAVFGSVAERNSVLVKLVMQFLLVLSYFLITQDETSQDSLSPISGCSVLVTYSF